MTTASPTWARAPRSTTRSTSSSRSASSVGRHSDSWSVHASRGSSGIAHVLSRPSCSSHDPTRHPGGSRSRAARDSWVARSPPSSIGVVTRSRSSPIVARTRAPSCPTRSRSGRRTSRRVPDSTRHSSGSTTWSSPSRSRVARWNRPDGAGRSRPSTRTARSDSCMAARASGVRSVRYVSGAGAAPDAERHWFRAKWRAEEAVRASGLAWTVVRPTWIYGPRDVSLNRFVGFARSLGMVPLTNRGRQLLAPVFVDDVARLLADTLEDPAAESADPRDRWPGGDDHARHHPTARWRSPTCGGPSCPGPPPCSRR